MLNEYGKHNFPVPDYQLSSQDTWLGTNFIHIAQDSLIYQIATGG